MLLTSHWISYGGRRPGDAGGLLLAVRAAGEHSRAASTIPISDCWFSSRFPPCFSLGSLLIPLGIALGKRRVSRAARPRCPIRQSRLAPRRYFLRRHDAREHHHRQPVELSRRRAYGDRAVLRSKLPCHEARIHRAPVAPHQAVSLRLLPRRARRTGWLQAKMAGTRQLMAVIFNSFPRPIESGHGKQPPGLLGRHLRAMPCARKVDRAAPSRDQRNSRMTKPIPAPRPF